RVDIIQWDGTAREFIRNALSPAKVGNIELDTENKTARVTVGNDQLSLAIGKSGQNVRLAAKLTGYKIDLVPSESVSDLDAAMQAAASRMGESAVVERGHTAFDALFSASPGGDAEAEETSADASEDASAEANGEPDAAEGSAEADVAPGDEDVV